MRFELQLVVITLHSGETRPVVAAVVVRPTGHGSGAVVRGGVERFVLEEREHLSVAEQHFETLQRRAFV